MNRRAPIIAGIASVVVIILVTVLLVLPKSGQVGDAEDQLATSQEKQQALQVQLAHLQDLRDSAPQYQRQLDENERLMPPTADQQGLIRALQLVATNAGVDFAVVSISAPSLGGSGDFSTISMTITVNGDFFQMAQYLFDLENLKERAVKVTGVQMGPSAYPQLTTNLTAEAYTTDISAGPGSNPGPQGAGNGGGDGSGTESPAP